MLINEYRTLSSNLNHYPNKIYEFLLQFTRKVFFCVMPLKITP